MSITGGPIVPSITGASKLLPSSVIVAVRVVFSAIHVPLLQATESGPGLGFLFRRGGQACGRAHPRIVRPASASSIAKPRQCLFPAESLDHVKNPRADQAPGQGGAQGLSDLAELQLFLLGEGTHDLLDALGPPFAITGQT